MEIDKQEIVQLFFEKTKIFGTPIMICRTGSFSYGLDTPNSDVDARGVFIPNAKYLLGLGTVEQVKVKDDDWVCHDIRQFIKILLKQNPTIMEMLYMEEYIYTTPLWNELLPKLRKLININAFKPYSAYVRSQLAKSGRDFVGKRKELVGELGFCPKFMSHVARLAVQCIFLMKEGHIPVRVPEPFKTDIINIKLGKLAKDEVFAYCEDLDKQMHEAYKLSKLPASTDINKFEEEYIELMHSLTEQAYDNFIYPWI